MNEKFESGVEKSEKLNCITHKRGTVKILPV